MNQVFFFLDNGIAIEINASDTGHASAKSARTRSQETSSMYQMPVISINDVYHVSILPAPAAARSTRVRDKPRR